MLEVEGGGGEKERIFEEGFLRERKMLVVAVIFNGRSRGSRSVCDRQASH